MSYERCSISGIILVTVMALCLGGCVEAESPPAAPTAERAPAPSPERRFDVAASEALLAASYAGSVELVRQALAAAGDPNARDADQRTSLMLAAFNGHTEVARLLLDGGADVDARDLSGRSSLMYAASGPNHETVQILLERGADTRLADSEEHFTALMFAASEGQTEVVRLLLGHGADPAVVDIDGDTALDFAIQNKHPDAAAVLGGNPGS